MSELTKDYSLEEVADALGMSGRWVRQKIADGKEGKGPAVEHLRYGHKIRFSADQVEAFRRQFIESAPTVVPITTGRKRSR